MKTKSGSGSGLGLVRVEAGLKIRIGVATCVVGRLALESPRLLVGAVQVLRLLIRGRRVLVVRVIEVRRGEGQSEVFEA